MTDLEKSYRARRESVLVPLASRIEDDLREQLANVARIDRVTARAKAVDRFLVKANKKIGDEQKYSDPLSQIQDQVGARIVTFYMDDVENVGAEVLKYYRPIEEQLIVPEIESEFGYISKHLVLIVPPDLEPDVGFGDYPRLLELQIKTLFQHAWAEASHDIAYKPTAQLSADERRKVALSAAQAWGSDMIFRELQAQYGTIS